MSRLGHFPKFCRQNEREKATEDFYVAHYRMVDTKMAMLRVLLSLPGEVHVRIEAPRVIYLARHEESRTTDVE